MEIINFFNCANHYEARQKEQEYFILLNANLNSIEPLPKPKIKLPIEKKEQIPIYCQSCNVYLKNNNFLEIHNNTKKHIKMCNTPILLDNKLKTYNYECEKCKFVTSNKKDYKRHLNTKKHNTIENQSFLITNSLLPIENLDFKCICGKTYKDKSGIWRHNKICNQQSTIQVNNIQNMPSEMPITKDNMNILEQQNCNINIKQHICKFCKKIYKSRVSLWYHNKKCQTVTETKITKKLEENINIIEFPTNEIIEMMKAQLLETQKMKKIMMEQSKQMMELVIDKYMVK